MSTEISNSAGSDPKSTQRLVNRSGTQRAPKRIIPGFWLTLGFTITYLSLIVLIPLSLVFVQTSGMGWTPFIDAVTNPRVLSALRLTFSISACAALINAVCGFVVAWVLVRYKFPGRGILDAAVDLPFAIPTSVAGIALTAIYVPKGWIGHLFVPAGIKIAFTPIGILIALTFVGLPFVVRTLQPVIEEMDSAQEEAAASLGASRWLTFWRVIIPPLLPALATGSTLAFARAIGEYGSVVFIAGNMPGKTEIVPLLIITKLEQMDINGATALAMVMLIISFVLLLAINLLQARISKRQGK